MSVGFNDLPCYCSSSREPVKYIWEFHTQQWMVPSLYNLPISIYMDRRVEAEGREDQGRGRDRSGCHIVEGGKEEGSGNGQRYEDLLKVL